MMRRDIMAARLCMYFTILPAVALAAASTLAAPPPPQSGTEPAPSPAQASPQKEEPGMRSGPSLDDAFDDMYSLKFDAARREIAAYEQLHADDVLARDAEAASYLFEEFQQKGIFSSAFFLDDKKFLGGIDGSPEANRNPQFLEANRRTREMATAHLQENSRDVDALVALAMADGMESDYDTVIEKKQLAGLEMMRSANGNATKALALDPDAKDAYVSLGVASYIIGCLPGYKRAFLFFGGIHGDRNHGIEVMQLAANGGHYLRPFAKIMLALAYEREHHFDLARNLLADLVNEYPENPRFADELAIAQRVAGRN